MNKNTCSLLSFHCLSDIDQYHNLSMSTCPSLPSENSDFEQVAANSPAQDLAVNSDVFISQLEHPLQWM